MVAAGDLFEYLVWQSRAGNPPTSKVPRIDALRGAATVHRRVAVVRGLLEYLVVTGLRSVNPVPGPGRSSGLRAPRRGSLGHLGPGRQRSGGRRLPEALDPAEVSRFPADLRTHRERAIVLSIVLGGPRSLRFVLRLRTHLRLCSL